MKNDMYNCRLSVEWEYLKWYKKKRDNKDQEQLEMKFVILNYGLQD